MSEQVYGYDSSGKSLTGYGLQDCECDCRSDNSIPAHHQEFTRHVWEIMDELGNLLITKQLDYGPGNVNNAFGGPVNGLLVRIGDKFERLKNLFNRNATPQHESIEDSFKDLANYGIIGLMVQRGVWPE